ncbi:hypothetical protein AXA88_18380 [Salmonella enterica]|nr:hypothetical protein [Salmonella enterica]EGW6281536.1 hypothetical protein [Salmonella enterica]EGX3933850.1 hypothetical protein [Salmonella enterica]
MSSSIIYSHPLAQATSSHESMEATMHHLKEWEKEFNKRAPKAVPVTLFVYGFTVGRVLKVKIEGDTLYGTLLIYSGKEVIERLDDVYANISVTPFGVVLSKGRNYLKAKAISKGQYRHNGN